MGRSRESSGAGTPAPAASAIPSARQAGSQPHGHMTRPPQASAAGTAARNGTPPAQTSQPAGAPAPASHPPSSGRNVSATVGSYAGTLSGNGKITLTLSDGKALSGRYTAGRLNLAGCAAALPLATVAGGAFTYHGRVP